MAGISDQAALKMENKLKFNGKELNHHEFSDMSGLDWYSYGMREYDPQIGRFFSVDPLTEKFYYLTPYQYASNNPVTNIDLDGLEGMFFQDALNWAATKVVENPNSGTSKAIGAVVGVGTSVQKTVTGVGNAIAHPINTLQGIANLSTPEGAVNMGLSVAGKIDAYNNGTGFEKSAIISEAVTDVATAVVGTKGIGAAVKGTEAAGVAGEATTLYRAASAGEVTDMAANGVRNISTGYETGKLFATSASDAAQYGKNNFGLDGIPNTVVPVQVSNAVMKTTTTFTTDGMKAVSIPANQLPNLKPLAPLNYTPKPTNPFGIPGW